MDIANNKYYLLKVQFRIDLNLKFVKINIYELLVIKMVEFID